MEKNMLKMLQLKTSKFHLRLTVFEFHFEFWDFHKMVKPTLEILMDLIEDF